MLKEPASSRLSFIFSSIPPSSKASEPEGSALDGSKWPHLLWECRSSDASNSRRRREKFHWACRRGFTADQVGIANKEPSDKQVLKAAPQTPLAHSSNTGAIATKGARPSSQPLAGQQHIFTPTQTEGFLPSNGTVSGLQKGSLRSAHSKIAVSLPLHLRLAT